MRKQQSSLTAAIPEWTVEEFLKEFGFCQAKDVNSEGLKFTYFTAKNTGHKIIPGYGIAIATV